MQKVMEVVAVILSFMLKHKKRSVTQSHVYLNTAIYKAYVRND